MLNSLFPGEMLNPHLFVIVPGRMLQNVCIWRFSREEIMSFCGLGWVWGWGRKASISRPTLENQGTPLIFLLQVVLALKFS